MSLNKLPQREQPRERMKLFGAQSLSLVELLAVLMGSGTKDVSALECANRLLTRYASLEALIHASPHSLSEVDGIGEVKSLQLKAAFELARRIQKEVSPFPIHVETLDDVAAFLQRYIVGFSQERLFVACLNTKGMLTHVEEVGIGTLSAVLVHPREVFSVAVAQHAAQIIIAHNHPSGDTTPSEKDITVTKVFQEAGKIMQIPLLEHIVLSEKSYTFVLRDVTKEIASVAIV